MRFISKYSLILLLCLLFVHCNSSNNKTKVYSESDCIKNVIAMDDSLGTLRNHSCEKITLSKTIHNYTNALGKIDFSRCPEEFSKAFDSHIEAWKNMTVLTDKYPNLRSEMHVLFDSIEQGTDSTEFKLLLSNIWSTWADIEKTMPSNKD